MNASEHRFLLNGFKRYRRAKKLRLGCVPYVSLAEEEAAGIINLMRLVDGQGIQIDADLPAVPSRRVILPEHKRVNISERHRQRAAFAVNLRT